MEEKGRLNEEMLGKVNGGTGEGYDQSGRKCPTCGSTKVRFLGEQGDCGKFVCDDCGSTFFSDI